MPWKKFGFSIKRFALIAAAVLLLSPGLARASVVAYEIQMTVSSFDDSFGDPSADPLGLAGSTLTLNLTADTTGLTPQSNRDRGGGEWWTVWGPGTVTAEMTFIGASGGGNGTFSALADDPFDIEFRDVPGPSDAVGFGLRIEAQVGAHRIAVDQLMATFTGDQFAGSAAAPIQPFAFAAGDVGSWGQAEIYYEFDSGSLPTGTTGSAVLVVPEPSLLSLLGLGFLFSLRRRRPRG